MHVKDYHHKLTEEERNLIRALAHEFRAVIESNYAPDCYNIGLYIHGNPVHAGMRRTLENVRNGVVKGHVNSTVIDEFFHNVLLMQIYTEKGISLPKR